MKAVMYGCGNIGRGFIGALLSQAGYEVTFIDVVDAIVDGLNSRRSYPIRIVESDSYEDIEITNVRAINGSDCKATAEAIAEADIMATAVGANILKFIAPNIAAGLKLRFALSNQPLDILICENLMDADKILAGLIKEHLNGDEQTLFDDRVGKVECSIGRMVPIQTPEMQDGELLRVCVERYGFLPVDMAAFKCELPPIRSLVPFSPFSYYLKRKLYLHNLGHCVCAYLGIYTRKTYIWEAVDDPNILLIAKNAMLESAAALSDAYGIPAKSILPHVDDLLRRFSNKALGDTCARVGADTRRKLAYSDRFIGAARFCKENGVLPVFIALGTAGALYQHLQENGLQQNKGNALTAIVENCGLQAEDEQAENILEFHCLLGGNVDLQTLRAKAGDIQYRSSSSII